MTKADRCFSQGVLAGIVIGLIVGLLIGLVYPPSRKDRAHYFRLGAEAACKEAMR